MKRLKADDKFGRLRFTLAYIDGDDIPELVADITSNTRRSGWRVYTYYDGGVVSVGDFGTYGTITFAPKQNMIMTTDTRTESGSETVTFESIQGGVRQLEKKFYSESSELADNTTWKIDDVEVTAEQYATELALLRDSYAYKSLDSWNVFVVTDENVARLIENPQSITFTPDLWQYLYARYLYRVRNSNNSPAVTKKESFALVDADGKDHPILVLVDENGVMLAYDIVDDKVENVEIDPSVTVGEDQICALTPDIIEGTLGFPNPFYN